MIPPRRRDGAVVPTASPPVDEAACAERRSSPGAREAGGAREAEAALRIAYSSEARESFRRAAQNMVGYCVEVTLHDGTRKDVEIVGLAGDLSPGLVVRTYRGEEPGAPAESYELPIESIEQLYVY